MRGCLAGVAGVFLFIVVVGALAGGGSQNANTPSRQAPAPAPAPRELPPGHQWVSAHWQSQMVDFTNHSLMVAPAQPVLNRFGRPLDVSLVIVCVEDTTSMYLMADEFLGLRRMPIQWRTDQNDLRHDMGNISTANDAVGWFHGSESIPLIRELMRSERLALRYTPHGENPRTAVFNVSGLGDRIAPLRAACHW